MWPSKTPSLSNTKRARFKFFQFILHQFFMKRKGIEKGLVILLFVLVLAVFSFAERDSKKLDRLYKTAELLQKNERTPTAHQPASHSR